MAVAGLFAGVVATGLAFPWLQDFYESTAMGSLTLPQRFHVPYGVVVFVITGIALAMFMVAERTERHFAAR
jgi:hypothetical protein